MQCPVAAAANASALGVCVAPLVGVSVGKGDGVTVAVAVGTSVVVGVGDAVGSAVAVRVGDAVGASVAVKVGAAVVVEVGIAVAVGEGGLVRVAVGAGGPLDESSHAERVTMTLNNTDMGTRARMVHLRGRRASHSEAKGSHGRVDGTQDFG
jgi:hypothetical protein